ncbi:Glycosyl transferases group 1 [compost metagenome]
MKIAVVLENLITAGGGFNQALNAILQMQRLSRDKFELEVFTTQAENLTYLNGLKIDATIFSFSLVDKLLARLSLNSWWQAIQRRAKLLGPFEKKLLAHKCHLVYFTTPSHISPTLQRLNYILTVWDLCHRDTPEFPEVRDFNQFYTRDYYCQNYLSPAVVVLVDSTSLADAISYRYGVDKDRLVPMPFTPSPFLESSMSIGCEEVLKKYELNKGYFFYPAQFWAHKNHIRILEALLLLKEKGISPSIVFAGRDYGNQGYIENFARVHGLLNQVHFLGFVAAADMRGLYEGCKAVVMPTYFGPTNLPPLEAWMMGRPLIYSSQFAEQAGDAAILINPDNAEDLAVAINACSSQEVCDELIEKGRLRLAEINKERLDSEIVLLDKLLAFQRKLQCWTN